MIRRNFDEILTLLSEFRQRKVGIVEIFSRLGKYLSEFCIIPVGLLLHRNLRPPPTRQGLVTSLDF